MRPIKSLRRRAASRKWHKARDELRSAHGTYRQPIQVCPRGCTHQFARRNVISRARLSGRVDVVVEHEFETKTCAKCGSRFVDRCGRCGDEIFAPVVDRCESCGLPHPWAAERRGEAAVRLDAGSRRVPVDVARVHSTRTQLRNWRLGDSHDPAIPLARIPIQRAGVDDPCGELFVIEGDIAAFNVRALISNDDVDGRMWSAIASSIRLSAGQDVEQESVSHGPYPLGSAWSTHAGRLRMASIIHVAAMDRHGENGGLEIVRDGIRAALEEAVRKKLHSVALAAIGTGPRPAIELNLWLRTIAADIVSFLKTQENAKLAVLLVLYEPDSVDDCIRLLSETVPETHRIAPTAVARVGAGELLIAREFLTRVPVDAFVSHSEISGRMRGRFATLVEDATRTSIEQESEGRQQGVTPSWTTDASTLRKGRIKVIHVAADNRDFAHIALAEAAATRVRSVGIQALENSLSPQTSELDVWLSATCSEVVRFLREHAAVQLRVVIVLSPDVEDVEKCLRLARRSVPFRYRAKPLRPRGGA